MTPVPAIRVQKAAALRIDEIFAYSHEHWGQAQAEAYVTGLFAAIDGLASERTRSRPIPAEFGVEGYFFRYRAHFVYWKLLENGDIGIVTVLHEAMHQIERFRDDFR